MKPKVATIFGASGFIGRHLIRRLTEKDFRIVAATRSPYLHGYLKPLGNPGQITSFSVRTCVGQIHWYRRKLALVCVRMAIQ